MRASPLDLLPIWGVFLATLLLVLGSIEGGYRIGRVRHKTTRQEKAAPVGSIVGASLGLLAFLLAFTFGLAATRFDTRRQIVIDEANAIGTAWLRAALLPEHTREIQELLRQYTATRLHAAHSGEIDQPIEQSESLHTQLWDYTTELGKDHPNSIVVGLFVQSLNQMIDIHAERVAAVRNRIPGSIWFSLYLIAMLSLGSLGYHSALSETSRSLVIVTVAVSFSIVIWLIANLDRPREGSLRVSQQVMIDLLESMENGGSPAHPDSDEK